MPDLPQKHEKLGPTKNPVEQQTPDGGEPFQGGGRRADLPYGDQQRQAADADYNHNLERTFAKDREAIGQMHGKTDGTPWVKGGSGRRGRDAT
jgi:hypothetical protein